ncbi:MAG: ACT domain-containing protein [Burkholderiales bacterium]|nr:ACT domain-containing protein [Burkholderiales bacterium]
MSALTFRLRPETFCIHRLDPAAALDVARFAPAAWVSITRSEDEVSIIAPEDIDLGPSERQPGWSCLQIEGKLDFALVGVLAGVARILAERGISILTVSTYDTDHVFVRTAGIEAAVDALEAAGHRVRGRAPGRNPRRASQDAEPCALDEARPDRAPGRGPGGV